MRKPPKGCVWIHIDRLNREDGTVWAVQWHDGKKWRYEVTFAVHMVGHGYTQFFGLKSKQPRAVIEMPNGRVFVNTHDIRVDNG